MLALALPVVASSLLERAVGIIDVFLVGGLGASAIAAVGASQLLVFMVSSMVAGLPAGTVVVVAQLWGAGRRPEAAAGARRVAGIALATGVAVGLCGMLWAAHAVMLLGASPEVVGLAQPYLRIVFAAFPFVFLVTVFSGILQGTGDTRSPLYVTTLMNIIHVAVAYPTIYGAWGVPRWELEGAALAVAVSNAVGAGCLAVIAYRRGLLARGRSDHFVRAVARVGAPVSVDRTLQQAAQLVFAKVVLLYGTTAYAAHQVGLAIEALSYLPGAGFALAAETTFGRSLGARTVARARMQSLEASRMALVVMAAMGVLFYVSPYVLLRLFTDDRTVIDLGTRFLHIVALLQIPLALTMVVSGTLKGAGDTRFLLFSTLAGAWGVRVPLALLFAYGLHLSLAAVWSVMLADWMVRMVVVLARYRSGAWRSHRVLWGAEAR
ncbi:MAG TPA: MATE family efflux transporter [Nitrospiria bacterium]|nr:MATE family efflux transporter [Nitrospiria bacterium]